MGGQGKGAVAFAFSFCLERDKGVSGGKAAYALEKQGRESVKGQRLLYETFEGAIRSADRDTTFLSTNLYNYFRPVAVETKSL